MKRRNFLKTACAAVPGFFYGKYFPFGRCEKMTSKTSLLDKPKILSNIKVIGIGGAVCSGTRNGKTGRSFRACNGYGRVFIRT